jgi:hypothetical protein
MNPPDYRNAACCLYCWHYGAVRGRCTKHGKKVDVLCVCADYLSEGDKEGVAE